MSFIGNEISEKVGCCFSPGVQSLSKLFCPRLLSVISQWLSGEYLLYSLALRWHIVISSHVLPIGVVPGMVRVEKDSRFWSFFKRKESQHWLVTMSIGGRKRNIGMKFTITPSAHLHIILNNVPVLYPHPSLLLLKLGDFTDVWFFSLLHFHSNVCYQQGLPEISLSLFIPPDITLVQLALKAFKAVFV